MNERNRLVVIASITGLLAGTALWQSGIHDDSHPTTDQTVRQELRRVLESDMTLSGLSISTKQLKIVNVTIAGQLADRAEVHRLRERITIECPTMKSCVLHWEIHLRDTKERVNGLDHVVFRELH